MLTILATVLALAPLGSEGPPPILQPQTYRSPDGHFALHVDPSRRDGGGPGSYSLAKDGAVAWKGEKPWTLWEGIVTDTGLVAGYAYTEGYRDYRSEGEFHAVILDARGRVVADVKTKRTSSRFFHTPPDPIGNGVLHVPASDLVFFGVSSAHERGRATELWCLQGSDGNELFRKDPAVLLEQDDSTGGLQAMRAVAGTPLILLQWSHFDFEGERSLGARYALFDSDLRKVWEALRPRDCNLTDEREQDRIRSLAWQGKLLLETDEPRRFDVWVPASGERVTFEVANGPADRSGASTSKPEWSVAEVARATHVESAVASAPEPESIELERRGSHDLEASGGASSSPIRDIRALAVDATGKVLSERSIGLPEADPELVVKWYPLTAHAWIGVQSPYGEGARAKAWTADDRSGAVQRLEKFDCPSVEDLSGFGDGRFVVLATERGKYTMHELVMACAPDGSKLWRLDQDYNSKAESALFAPEALAVAGDSRVWIVDNIANCLQIFGADGSFVRRLDLAQVLGQKPNYPSGLQRDVDGGVLFDDFNGKPRMWRLDASGGVRSSFDPRFADGRVIAELPRNARVAPDGRMWSTDGARLLRMDERGVVDLEVGARLAPDELTAPSASAIDVFGRALIQDEKTGAVHVFGGDGKRLFVCKPEPKEVGNTSSIATLSAMRDGGVLAEQDGLGYMTFDAHGKRKGLVKDLPDNLVISPVSGIAAGSKHGGTLVLMDEQWKATKLVERRPDRQWLVSPASVAFGPDGAIAVLDGGFSMRPDPPAVVLYSRDAGDGRVVPLTSASNGYRIALGRAWAAVFAWDAWCNLVRLSDGAVRRFVLPDAPESRSSYTFGFSAQGDELIVLDKTRRKLHRFALP